MMPPKILEGLFGWYFERVYVQVRPERVFVWPDGDPATSRRCHDSHLEEVRSGHIEEPAAATPGAGGGRVPGTTASRSSATATRPRSWPGSRRTGSRSRSGFRSAWTGTGKRIGSTPSPPDCRSPKGRPA